MEAKEIWVKRFKEWEESGLKRAEYCRQNEIPLTTFDYWRYRIRKELKSDSEEKGLVQLPMLFKQSPSVLYSVEFPSGYKVHIPENYRSESLRRLISDLSEALK